MIEPTLALSEQMDASEQREADHGAHPRRLGRRYCQRGSKRQPSRRKMSEIARPPNEAYAGVMLCIVAMKAPVAGRDRAVLHLSGNEVEDRGVADQRPVQRAPK